MANDIPEDQTGNKGTRATPDALKAWRDGLQDRVRAACIADGMSDEAFTIAFGEIIQAISE